MDATTFRWVLVLIAVVVVIAIYLYGVHQSRLRRRSAMDTFTREEIDSAFIEDEQLRFELNNLNQLLQANEEEENLDQIQINPAGETPKTPFALPDPEIFLPPEIAASNGDRVISYHLRHEDFRLITGEEANSAVQHAGLELAASGMLEYRDAGEIAFRVVSMTAPGNFSEIDRLDFTTLGFNCYIDRDDCADLREAYETMLKKIDELVRMLNVKVYKPNQELLTISDVTDLRDSL